MGQVTIQPPVVTQGEIVTITITPDPGCTVRKTASLIHQTTDEEFGFRLIEAADGVWEAALRTIDWEPGNYQIEYFEVGKAEYSLSQLFTVNAAAQDPYQVFKDLLIADRIGLFDFNTLESVSEIIPGQELVVAVNAEGLYRVDTWLTAEVPLDGQDETLLQARVVGEPGLPNPALVSMMSEVRHAQYIRAPLFLPAPGDYPFTIRWHTFPDQWTGHHETLSGTITVSEVVQSEPIPEYDSYPFRKFTIGFFYYGSLHSPAEIEQARLLFTQELHEATRGYFDVESFAIDSAPLPDGDDGQGGNVYWDWWETLSHDLAGTPYEGEVLDPANPDDLHKARHLWYKVNMTADEVLGEMKNGVYTPGSQSEDYVVFLTDAALGYTMGKSSAGCCGVSVVESAQFTVTANGGTQYKAPTVWELQTPNWMTSVAVHECGHGLFLPVVGSHCNPGRYPFLNIFWVLDHSQVLEHRNCYMYTSRDRESLDEMFYHDEHLGPFIEYFAPPWVTIEASQSTLVVDEPVVITVTGHSQLGLSFIWWWGEDTGDASLDRAHPFDAGGEVAATHSWSVSFSQPGTFLLKANARDIEYPRPGEPHQASEGTGMASATITVT